MKLLWCWAVTLWILFRYPFYRIGIGKRPLFTDHWDQVEVVYRQITRMDPRIRVRHEERCPKQHPAVYAGNHIKYDDSFFVCYALQEASNYTMHTRFVMREDFFQSPPWSWLPFSINELAEMGGCHNISQDSPSIAQLRPLVDVLIKPDSFVIFPCGGRSKSGLWMESHVGDEPGSIAFFLAQAQRKQPDLAVPAVPAGRTYNPVKKVSAVIIGEPRCLAPGARRDAQRDFDAQLFTDISDLIEIHALHLVCAILYLRCHHGKPAEIATTDLVGACHTALAQIRNRYIDPALPDEMDRDVRAALRYLQKRGMLQYHGDLVHVNRDAVLAPRPFDARFRVDAPVQFHVNQLVHLADVFAALEDAVER